MARRDMMASSTISMSFDKAQVVKILTTNREEHEEIYNEAVAGYRKKFKAALKEYHSVVDAKQKELKDDKKVPKPYLNGNPLIDLKRPNSSLKEYDTVLEMLSLTPDETIVLDQDQYNCYMKDNWHWMDAFLISNSAYSSKAFNKLSSR